MVSRAEKVKTFGIYISAVNCDLDQPDYCYSLLLRSEWSLTERICIESNEGVVMDYCRFEV